MENPHPAHNALRPDIAKRRRDVAREADRTADHCGICGIKPGGAPIMTHRPTGTACCEKCGDELGVTEFLRLAHDAVGCPGCGFRHLAGLARFTNCPLCGQLL